MTYSIVARDPASGAVGVAAATGLVAIGALVPHVRWGAGWNWTIQIPSGLW